MFLKLGTGDPRVPVRFFFLRIPPKKPVMEKFFHKRVTLEVLTESEKVCDTDYLNPTFHFRSWCPSQQCEPCVVRNKVSCFGTAGDKMLESGDLWSNKPPVRIVFHEKRWDPSLQILVVGSCFFWGCPISMKSVIQLKNKTLLQDHCGPTLCCALWSVLLHRG